MACPQDGVKTGDTAAPPLDGERLRRYRELARLAELDLYEPDLDALAERLVDARPDLFGPGTSAKDGRETESVEGRRS